MVFVSPESEIHSGRIVHNLSVVVSFYCFYVSMLLGQHAVVFVTGEKKSHALISLLVMAQCGFSVQLFRIEY